MEVRGTPLYYLEDIIEAFSIGFACGSSHVKEKEFL